MIQEIDGITSDLRKGDRVHFFWHQFPDDSILNGGANILDLSDDVPTGARMAEAEEWTDERTKKYEEQRENNELMVVTLQLDYYPPTDHVMNKNMPLLIYRRENNNHPTNSQEEEHV